MVKFLFLFFEQLVILASCCLLAIRSHEDGFLNVFSPGTKQVYLNIGSNESPIYPPEKDETVFVLAFEPLLSVINGIVPHDRLFVIPAAVSSTSGLRTFHVFNDKGLSSSLSTPQSSMFWNDNKSRGDGKKVVVPALSMSEVIVSIPPEINIRYLKTDMQGHDFISVESAGTQIQRIDYIKTEVSYHNARTYANIDNDFCRNWLPHMTALGFRLHAFEVSSLLRYGHKCLLIAKLIIDVFIV
jgi:hypothetical protein